MRAWVAMAALVELGGCGVTEGPLLRARDGGAFAVDASASAGAGASADAGPTVDTGVTSTSMPAFPADVTWQYQLVGQVDPELDARLFVIDLFNVSSTLIERLHEQGKLAVAYLSAGTLENFRDDADLFPDAAVGSVFEAYPNESWLDVRDPGVRTRMAERLDVARDKGFDGVVPTNLTAYQHESGFDLSAADQADYTIWLSAQAHARGLHVGMAGDYGQLPALVASFDWAVDFGCIARNNCARLAPFSAQGKPVLDVETEGDPSEVCGRARTAGVNVIIKRPELGAYRVTCP
jgi:hypothetical protein